MQNLQFRALFFILIVSLTGCAASPEKVANVDGLLNGQCKEMFIRGGLGSYQHAATIFLNGKAVFALGEDANGNQKCAYASAVDTCVSWYTDTGEDSVCWVRNTAEAIRRCENITSVNATCRVLARNNKIVWDPSANKLQNTNKSLENKPVANEGQKSQATNASLMSVNEAQSKCEELGFSPKTEKFGQCVLQLSK